MHAVLKYMNVSLFGFKRKDCIFTLSVNFPFRAFLLMYYYFVLDSLPVFATE